MVTKIDRMKNILVLHNQEEKAEIMKKKKSFADILKWTATSLLLGSPKRFLQAAEERSDSERNFSTWTGGKQWDEENRIMYPIEYHKKLFLISLRNKQQQIRRRKQKKNILEDESYFTIHGTEVSKRETFYLLTASFVPYARFTIKKMPQTRLMYKSSSGVELQNDECTLCNIR